jgi:hypothetical protein
MNNFEFQSLLNIGIYKKKIKYIDNNKIYQEIKKYSKSLDSSFNLNKNHSYFEDQTYPFDGPESNKLMNCLANEVSLAVGQEMLLNEIWTLTLRNGESVGYHSHKSNNHLHPSEYYSIAYYVNVPIGSSDIQFNITACNTLESSVSVKAEDGLLIIFNSFIPHMTNRHNNVDQDRVVVSANFSPKDPTLILNQDWTAYWDKK